MSSTSDRLAQAIQQARRAKGLTQQELADLTGLDREYLSRLEGGTQTKFFARLELLLDSVGLALVTTPKSLLVDDQGDPDS